MPNGSAILTDDSGKLYTIQDKDEVLDYPFNFAEELDAVSDTIIAGPGGYEFEIVDPTGATTPLAVGASSLGNGTTDSGTVVTNAQVTVFVSGGTVNKKHILTCRVHTVDGRTYDKALAFKIKDLL